jgi:Mg2+/Co2+ transporter CorB
MQQQLTDHERRLIRLEDYANATRDQMRTQQTQMDQITQRIDAILDQNNRLYRAIISVGGTLVVALVGTIVTMIVR